MDDRKTLQSVEVQLIAGKLKINTVWARQSHFKVSVLVSQSAAAQPGCWTPKCRSNPDPETCLWKVSQACKTMSLLHLVRIKAERQAIRGEVWFVFCTALLLSSSSSLRWVFLPDIISFSGLAQSFPPDSFVLLTFGSTLHWLCFRSCFTHINV